MRRRPPRSTRTDTLFPTRRSSDLIRRTALRNAVAGGTTRRSATLADALAGAAEGDFVFVRPETLQTLFDAAAPTLDAAAVTEAFRKRVAGMSPPLVWVTGKTPVAGGADAMLAALDRKSGG